MSERLCRECGDPITHGDWRSVTCGPVCRAARKRRQAAANARAQRRKPGWLVHARDYQRERYASDPAYRQRELDRKAERTAEAREAGAFRVTFLDEARYEAMLRAQGGVCAICRRPETARTAHGLLRRLAIDHDHETDEIRGLICTRCNTALGLLADDPDLLRAAAAYLEAQARYRDAVSAIKGAAGSTDVEVGDRLATELGVRPAQRRLLREEV